MVPFTAGVVLGCLVVVLLVIGMRNWSIDVRNSAPFGSVQTIDTDRGIAVVGGTVTPTYGSFDGVGLDLRAYGADAPDTTYDFILTVRDLQANKDIRRVAFTVDGRDITASKSAFSDIITRVSFDPVADSAGKSYYVLVEKGPRNVEDIVTLWGIQTFSSVLPLDVVDAAMHDYPIALDPETTRNLIHTVIVVVIVMMGVVAGAVTYAAMAGRSARPT